LILGNKETHSVVSWPIQIKSASRTKDIPRTFAQELKNVGLFDGRRCDIMSIKRLLVKRTDFKIHEQAK